MGTLFSGLLPGPSGRGHLAPADPCLPWPELLTCTHKHLVTVLSAFLLETGGQGSESISYGLVPGPRAMPGPPSDQSKKPDSKPQPLAVLHTGRITLTLTLCTWVLVLHKYPRIAYNGSLRMSVHRPGAGLGSVGSNHYGHCLL